MPEQPTGDPRQRIRELFDQAESKREFMEPVDAFAVMMLASARYLNDAETTAEDKRAATELASKVYRRVMRGTEGASNGQLAFALVGAMALIGASWHRQHADAVVPMLPAARQALMNNLIPKLLVDVLTNTQLGLL